MSDRVTVRPLGGKRLQGATRNHTVVTDRKTEDGGTDAGPTSGELLLLAMGSCAAGSLRSYLEQKGTSCRDLTVDVFFEPTGKFGVRDRIVIALGMDERLYASDPEGIRVAATSGGVNSRMKLGSEIEVRFTGRGGETGV